ncbi:MAG: hypothetical protein NTW97_00415 [Candidatus Krumholzibacteria bacterium]|nr:hypothetical protein [Candidatus Krumholzibacteria bacterium]
MKNREVILPTSIAFLCISLLLHRWTGSSSWINFFEGVFLGMSLALAVFALVVGALSRSHE